MNTLDYVMDRFDLRNTPTGRHGAIEIPNFGRVQMADLFKDLGYTLGVEVGVAAGVYSEMMMQANPGVTIYGVDPYVKHDGYIDYQLSSTFNKLETEAHKRLDRFPNYHFVKKLSMDALEDFEDGSLDFVYLDGDHSFVSVVNDIDGWSRKLRKGGIISGHDFARHRRQGTKIHVVQAVKGYTDSYGIRPWFILGREANNEGLIREKIRSWMWII